VDELIRSGLTQKQKSLPAALLYDELGSVLFEAITLLPEYELARVDLSMLEQHARAAFQTIPGPLELIELGPGHGRKAKLMLESLLSLQKSVRFFPIDVSAGALRACQSNLEDLQGVEVTLVEAGFAAGLAQLPKRQAQHRRMVLFLGSSLSNFDAAESLTLFRDIRAHLEVGDGFLLCVDLEKPKERLLPAYDDALGVTSSFNKNVLSRLNREWGANFELQNFIHEARWNEAHQRIEMHLRAKAAAEVSVATLKLKISFQAGETIWTESSHRFTIEKLRTWGLESKFQLTQHWVDSQWPFAVLVFTAA
jgi:L-histidine Nalpha-methyltransferase